MSPTLYFRRMGDCPGSESVTLPPLMTAMIPKRISNKRTVAQALIEWRWVSDIHGTAMVQLLVNLLKFLINTFGGSQVLASIQQGQPIWGCFKGPSPSTHGSAYGRHGHRTNVIFSYGWSPMTAAEQLTGWSAITSHTRTNAHCDQDDETIQHLLVRCVFARQFWFALLQRFGLIGIAPEQSEKSLDDWWSRVGNMVTNTIREGLNTLLVLGAWTL
jgi:hypothetical protein